MRLDLSQAVTSSQMAEMVKEHVAAFQKGEWVIGDGWNENEFPDKKIFHRKDLDEISPNNPLMLTRICRHAALVNSKALEIAGITKNTTDPVGGVIVKDKNGEPTGYLLDLAQDIVKECIPSVSEEYISKALTLSVTDLISKGLVGGHTEDLHYYGGFKRTLDQFLTVINEWNIPFRTNLLVHHGAIDEMIDHHYQFGELTPFISIGAMKIFADGALGGRTAFLEQPYADDPSTHGVAIHSQKELCKLVKKARKYNMPVAIHAIGDEALAMAVEAIENYPPPKRERDRIIHAQVVTNQLIEKLKCLDVVLDIQPQFVTSDFPWVIERLGESRMKLAYAWKTLLRENIACAGGSDAPIEEPNPLLAIHAAVTRRRPKEDHEGYYPSQKLTVFEAVQLYTSGSAKAITNENQQGLIAPGYLADFTVLDQDLFEIEEEKIVETTVAMTVINDQIVYEKNVNQGGGGKGE